MYLLRYSISLGFSVVFENKITLLTVYYQYLLIKTKLVVHQTVFYKI